MSRSTVVTGQLQNLRAHRQELAKLLQTHLQLPEQEGRSQMRPNEISMQNQLRQLDANIKFQEGEVRRAGDPARQLGLTGQPGRGRAMSAHSNVYPQYGGQSYLADLVNHQLQRDGTGAAARRLYAHADEVQRNMQQGGERRDLGHIDSEGGYLSPPSWQIESWIEYARPGKPTANLFQAFPCPAAPCDQYAEDSYRYATQIQVADNTQVLEQDLTDTYISSPIRTIAGQQSVSLQLIDQCPVNFDDIVLQDLAAAHAVNLDQQVLNGTGSAGQLQGINYLPGITTTVVAGTGIQDVYNAIANAIQLVLTTRYRPPTHVIMHRAGGQLFGDIRLERPSALRAVHERPVQRRRYSECGGVGGHRG